MHQQRHVRSGSEHRDLQWRRREAITGTTIPTTFNNLTINAGAAGVVTLAQNVTVAGNLTVSGGTFDLLTFTADRTTAGGTLSVTGTATLRIAGTNGIPANYATRTFVATTTVAYRATTSQSPGSCTET